MERTKFTTRVQEPQIKFMAANLALANGPDGRRTQDFWLQTERQDFYLCVEKPTDAKCRELAAACVSGLLSVTSDPTKGGNKNQIGTQYGSCWLRAEPDESVGARRVRWDPCAFAMNSPRALAAYLSCTLAAELPNLRAVPDGSATAAPNRPSGVGWSQREELGHLIDSALNNHARIVRASLEPRYEGPGYDQESWVAAHHYGGIAWTDLVEIWHAHNRILVPLVAGIADAKLATPCTVGGGAPVTLGFLIDDYVLHMRHHLDQVLRRRPATKYPRG